MSRKTGLDESDRRKVQFAIDAARTRYIERQPRRARWAGVGGGGRVRIGILDAALTAPATITSTLPTASVSRYTLNSGTGQLEDSGSTDTVSNPFPGLEGASGAAIGYQPYGSIWIPFWIDCDSTNEVQTLTITGTPTGGTFTLTYQGQATSGIAHNASAATVQTALEGLSSIGSGNVSCSGGDLPGTAVDIEFQGVLANTNVDLIMADGGSLTGGSDPDAEVTVDTEGCCG